MLACLGVLFQDSALAIQLGLAVQVCRAGSGISLVGSSARRSREDVVSGDVNDEDISGCRQLGEALAGCNVERPRALRVPVNLVGEPLGRACNVSAACLYI